MKYSAKRTDLEKLSREDLINQAGVVTWLLLNECLAKGGNFRTAPIRDEPFDDYELEIGGLSEDPLTPDKPTVLKARKKEIVENND